MATKTQKETKQENVLEYTKEQILASKKYSNRRDALGAILSDGCKYTFDKIDSLLEKFMKGKVN